MPAPLQNSIVHTVYYTVWYHIYTYWYPCSLFTYILLFFFSNSGSYYTVFNHYKSQKSACSASGKTDIRQGSKNHQAVVKQSSGSG